MTSRPQNYQTGRTKKIYKIGKPMLRSLVAPEGAGRYDLLLLVPCLLSRIHAPAKAALEQVLQQAGTACHSLCPEMEELSISMWLLIEAWLFSLKR